MLKLSKNRIMSLLCMIQPLNKFFLGSCIKSHGTACQFDVTAKCHTELLHYGMCIDTKQNMKCHSRLILKCINMTLMKNIISSLKVIVCTREETKHFL